jgi:ketosteroid isomerase-like protein
MKKTSAFLLIAALLSVPPGHLAAQDRADPPASPDADAAAVVAVVDAFHAALEGGDGDGALALLAPGARILEGGGVETAEEYASHHLAADMRFSSAVKRERGPVEVVVRGDVAWAMSTSRAVGTVGEREIDSRGAELVVLSRGDDGWRIEAIHWSSR